jgi:hypothetical protein
VLLLGAAGREGCTVPSPERKTLYIFIYIRVFARGVWAFANGLFSIIAPTRILTPHYPQRSSDRESEEIVVLCGNSWSIRASLRRQEELVEK